MGCFRSGLAVSAFLTVPALAEPPPIEVYAALPAVEQPHLSPDGDRVALIAPIQGKPTLVVRALGGDTLAAVGTGPTLPDWFEWKNDDRLLVSVRFTARHSGVDDVMETRLLFLSPDGKEAVPVRLDRQETSGAVVIGNPGNRVPQFQDQVISLLPHDPDHILMAVTPLEDVLHPDIVQIDIHSGRPRVKERHRGDVVRWLADQDGVVKGAVAVGRANFLGKDVHETVMVRSGEDDDWRVVEEHELDQGRRFEAAGVAGGTLYALSESDNQRLVAMPYDIASRQWGAMLVGERNCDTVAFYHDHRISGFIAPCGGDGRHYLDPAWQNDYLLLRKALKNDSVQIQSRSADGKRTLAILNEKPTAPPSFWLLDRRGGRAEAKWIGDAYGKLPVEALADMKAVSYSARDGQRIPAFLTLPIGERKGPIPFVVLPHGGPSQRDHIGFDWMVQFLASRGYGVLQPQFRGSSGFGRAFEEAGYQQWGGLMQDDVTDGTRWLIEQGYADPAHIAIVGGSYGGYAALMGVAKEPELYACAAAFAPVTDLDSFVSRQRNFAFKDANIPRIKGEGQSLADISPVELAERIRVPVLLMHGDKDFTVPVEHSQAMERALKRRGKTVEAVYLEGADHYFGRASDRLAWLQGLDRLLAANLGR